MCCHTGEMLCSNAFTLHGLKVLRPDAHACIEIRPSFAPFYNALNARYLPALPAGPMFVFTGSRSKAAAGSRPARLSVHTPPAAGHDADAAVITPGSKRKPAEVRKSAAHIRYMRYACRAGFELHAMVLATLTLRWPHNSTPLLLSYTLARNLNRALAPCLGIWVRAECQGRRAGRFRPQGATPREHA